MDEIIAFVAWLVVEVVLIQTGRIAIWIASFGRWRGESMQAKEGRIYSAAGALTFKREGQRVFTVNGLLFAGIAVYVVLAIALLFYAAKIGIEVPA